MAMSILLLMDLGYTYKSQVMTVSRTFFYNDWTRDHCVSNLFAFAPDGTIPEFILDAPESLHDSIVADFGSLYTLLTGKYVLEY